MLHFAQVFKLCLQRAMAGKYLVQKLVLVIVKLSSGRCHSGFGIGILGKAVLPSRL